MQAYTPRAGRRSLARTIVILSAATVLGACANETTAPTAEAPSRPHLAGLPEFTTSVDLSVGQVTVDPAYGATVRLAITCSANEVFDVVVDLQQERKAGMKRILVQGSGTFPALTCTDAIAGFAVPITQSTGAFLTGRATVRARIANYQPWVEPADVTRRVRIVAE